MMMMVVMSSLATQHYVPIWLAIHQPVLVSGVIVSQIFTASITLYD